MNLTTIKLTIVELFCRLIDFVNKTRIVTIISFLLRHLVVRIRIIERTVEGGEKRRKDKHSVKLHN